MLKRAALAFPFVLAALPVIFTTPGEAIFTLSPGPWTLTASLPGLERFASIAVKSWISVQAAIVLAASTPFPDLLVAMRAVRVPRMLVAIFGLMWRYLFVLVDEVLRLLRARAARSGISADAKLKTGGSSRLAGAGGGGDGRQPLPARHGAQRPYLPGNGLSRLRWGGARHAIAGLETDSLGCLILRDWGPGPPVDDLIPVVVVSYAPFY